MRIVAFLNNRLGLLSLRYLRDAGADIVGLVLHPQGVRKFGPEIIEAAGLADDAILDGGTLREASTVERVGVLKPDMGISVLFGYILRPSILRLFPRGVANLHPSLLPYNRGAFPNVWSIIDGTPAGVTLHWIDEGVDTGNVIDQRRVEVLAEDTGKTLYERLEAAGLALLQETWPRLARGETPSLPQLDGSGTSHRVRDIEAVDRIELDRNYRARDLINILRARTFPPYKGAYFVDNGEKVHIRIELERERESAKD